MSEQKMNEQVEKMKKQAKQMRVKEKIPNYVLYIAVFIFILSAVFVQEVLLDPSQLQEVSFWTIFATKVICSVVVLYSRLYERGMDLVENSEEKKTIDKEFLILSANPDMVALEKYIDEQNRANKIKEYKIKKTNKLMKLNSSFLNSAKALHIWENGTKEQKSKNLYCKKRMKLEYELSDAYIEKHIDYMNIKCQTWSYPMLMSKNRSTDVNSTYIPPMKEYANKKALSKVITMLMFAVMGSVLVFSDAKFQGWGAVRQALLNLLPIISSYASATMSAKDLLNNEIKFSWARIEFYKLFLNKNKKEGENK